MLGLQISHFDLSFLKWEKEEEAVKKNGQNCLWTVSHSQNRNKIEAIDVSSNEHEHNFGDYINVLHVEDVQAYFDSP